MDSKLLTLKKYHFLSNPQTGQIGLAKWLQDQPLIARQSRSRSAFLRLLNPLLIAIDEGMSEILDRHAVKDEEGTVKMPRTSVDEPAANKELVEFLNEDFIIDITKANETTIAEIRSVLNNTPQSFSGQMAINYDEWCEAFEKIT